MDKCLCVPIPDAGICIRAGDVVKLGRFDRQQWIVRYDWYACNGNRPVLGWFLQNKETQSIKPLQLTDLDDIYFVEI